MNFRLAYQNWRRSSNQNAGIPEIIWYGQEGDQNCLIMELMDKSLEDLFVQQNRKFTLKTVLMLADQLIDRVQYLHEHNFIHRDIKPDNFMIGKDPKGSRSKDKSRTIFMIDFGLSKRYRDPRTKEHISFRDKKELTGTIRYASLAAVTGSEQSRRDDLESIGYLLIYFLKGQLPWQGLKARTFDQKCEVIKQKRIQTSIEELTSGLPRQFQEYMQTCRNIPFEEEPDYRKLRGLFSELMHINNFEYDYQFDWTPKKDQSGYRPFSGNRVKTMYSAWKSPIKENSKAQEIKQSFQKLSTKPSLHMENQNKTANNSRFGKFGEEKKSPVKYPPPKGSQMTARQQNIYDRTQTAKKESAQKSRILGSKPSSPEKSSRSPNKFNKTQTIVGQSKTSQNRNLQFGNAKPTLGINVFGGNTDQTTQQNNNPRQNQNNSSGMKNLLSFGQTQSSTPKMKITSELLKGFKI
eukprot:403333898